MQNRTVIRSAFTVGGFTMLSRILGMVRDILTAGLFGTSLAFSAFTVAFRIPNLFRALFGEGALSAAFIPVFQETRQTRGEAEAWRLANRIASLAGVVLLGVMALGILGMSGTLWWAPGLSEKTLTILPLARIMLPYVFFICLAALAMGVLNSYRKFSTSAFTPTLLNVTWILSVLFVIPVFKGTGTQITVLAWTVFVAGAVQLGYLLWPLRCVGWRAHFDANWSDPLVRRVFLLMGPSALGLAVNQVNVLLSSWLAMMAGAWAPSTLFYAERLIYLPQGILATSLGVVLLPVLSEFAVRGEHENMRDAVQHGLRTLLFVMTPAAIGLLVLASPVVRLLFEHGRFDATSTMLTARALQFYAPGLMVFCLAKVFVPAFYALQDTKTPVKIGLCSVGICLTCNLVAVSVLPEYWRHAGLAASTVVAEAFNGTMLAKRLHRRLGALRYRAVLATVARALGLAVAMGAVAYFSNDWLFAKVAAWRPALAPFAVLPAIVAGVVVYFALAKVFRVPELGFVTEALRNRRKRKAPAE